MKRAIFTVFGIIVLTAAGTQLCSADIIHLNNGKTFEGQIKESDEGYWVDGLLFKKDEVKTVEKKELSKEYTGEKNVIEKLKEKFGYEDEQEIKRKEALEAYHARMEKKNAAMKKWMAKEQGIDVPEDDEQEDVFVEGESLEEMGLVDQLKMIKQAYEQGADFEGNTQGSSKAQSNEEYIDSLFKRTERLQTIDEEVYEIIDKYQGKDQ